MTGQLTAIYWIIFGLLGAITTNSSFVELFVLMTVVGTINIFDVNYIAISLLMSLVSSRFVVEWIRFFFAERSGERTNLLSILLSSSIYIYTYFTIHLSSLFLLGYCLLNTICFLIFLLLFKKGTKHVAKYRALFLYSLLSIAFVCIGFLSLLITNQGFMWMKVVVGEAGIHAFLSYTTFVWLQIIVSIRGINCKRKLALSGSPALKVVQYLGRTDF